MKANNDSQSSMFTKLSVKKKKDSKEEPQSMIDQFNKKLLEKGTDRPLIPSDLPQAGKYLEKRFDRP